MGMMTGGMPLVGEQPKDEMYAGQQVGQGSRDSMFNMPTASDPATSHGAYNGVVDVQGQQVEVKNGIAKVEGQPYFVSDNGAMVVDHQGKLIGHVENGVFQVVTADYMNKMAEAGYIR